MIGQVGIGDVLAVNTGNALTSVLIRFGEALMGKPNLANHVVIVHNLDERGTWWGIEGRPGGVGYVDIARYTDSLWARYSNSNAPQPRTGEQRALIAKAAEGLLGVQYDWVGGIACDALDALRLKPLAGLVDAWWGWKDPAKPGMRPAHVVCSSLAAWVYRNLGLACPAVADEELCTPADWWDFNNSLQSAAAQARPEAPAPA
jgi:cell wall-associated NlpC family hydrolase